MLIAFIALIATINGLLSWLGGFFGYGSLSLQLILGWIFSPLAWLIGVPWAEAGTIGSLVGQKLVLNEFVAYSELTKLIPPLSGTTALLSDKAIVIATFALCGFANFSSIGINIGCIGGLAPSRQADLAQLGFRAMLGGALASCMTASLAGMLL
jgi:CNT family concentrative nucleoside transporter